MINLQRAEEFLNRFGWPHTFQTFDDAGKGRRELVRVLHASTFNAVHAELARLNNDGAGIFFTVNGTDGRGRKRENITRVRALFVDADGTAAPHSWHRCPDVFVWRDGPQAEVNETGMALCRWHAYWLTGAVSLEKFSDHQKRLAAYYHTDPAVHDLPRVMRVPGFAHRKSSVPQELYLERV